VYPHKYAQLLILTGIFHEVQISLELQYADDVVAFGLKALNYRRWGLLCGLNYIVQVNIMQEIIRSRFDESLAVVRQVGEKLSGRIEEAARLIIASYKADGGLYAFGNGGSAADAQHIVAELVGRFLIERKALRAQALTTDTSILTSVANDYDFEMIFSRQLEACGRPGDIALAISTSGNSPNVLAGLQTARNIGMKTIALTGPGGGQCAKFADILLDVGDPGTPTPRVQEAHIVIYHVLCELVEAAMAEEQ